MSGNVEHSATGRGYRLWALAIASRRAAAAKPQLLAPPRISRREQQRLAT